MKYIKKIILALSFVPAIAQAAAAPKFTPARGLLAPLTDINIPLEVSEIVKSYLTNDLRSASQIEGYGEYVTNIIELDDNKIASTHYDGTIKIWDIPTSKCLKVLERHREEVKTLVKTLIESEGKIISGSLDRTIRIWDINSGECLKILEGHASGVYALILLDDHKIASASYDKTIRIWDINSGQLLKILKTDDYVIGMQNGHFISVNDNKVKIFDIKANRFLEKFSIGYNNRDHIVLKLPNNTIATAFYDSICLWDINSGKCLKTLTSHGQSVTTFIQLPGNRIASGSWDKTIKIWDINSGKCIHTEQCEDAVLYLMLTNKKEILAGLNNGRIHKFVDLYSAIDYSEKEDADKKEEKVSMDKLLEIFKES